VKVALTEDGLKRLEAEALTVTENLQSTTLNMMVIYSLLLTLYVSMIIMTAGGVAYTAPDEMTAAVDLAFGATDVNHSSAWADFASWAWPSDLLAQQSLRRGCYIAEFTVNVIGVVVCLLGLYEGIVYLLVWGNGLPDNLSKLEFYCESPGRTLSLWLYYNIAILLMPVGVAFVCVRASAIAFLCMCGAATLFFIAWNFSVLPGGLITSLEIKLHREATRRLRPAFGTAP